jgi:multidrug efflux system membrane fusion protein
MKKLKSGEKLAVGAFDRAGKTQLASGTLITVDNQIDPATGTVKLRAQFANEDLALFPNQFVNVRLLVDTRKGATVIPGAAVQRGAQGSFVFAVDRETKVVSVRKLRLGPVAGERVAIEEGLTPGTLVVVDGADKLREGAVVELVVRDDRPPPEAPSAEERLRRWKALNERIDRGEFGEAMKKLPEEERKQKMRELRAKKGR